MALVGRLLAAFSCNLINLILVVWYQYLGLPETNYLDHHVGTKGTVELNLNDGKQISIDFIIQSARQQTEILLVPKLAFAPMVFDSENPKKLIDRVNSNIENIHNTFRELWPGCGIPEPPTSFCQNRNPEETTTEANAKLFRMGVFHWPVFLSGFVWAISRQRCDHSARANESFRLLITILIRRCKDRALNLMIQFRRIGDDALIQADISNLQLYDLWTPQAWALCGQSIWADLCRTTSKTWFSGDFEPKLGVYLAMCFDWHANLKLPTLRQCGRYVLTQFSQLMFIHASQWLLELNEKHLQMRSFAKNRDESLRVMYLIAERPRIDQNATCL